MSPPPPKVRFLKLVEDALHGGTFAKITLSKYRGPDSDLRNVYGRIVMLRAGPHLSLVYRYATRDVTKNLPVSEGMPAIERLLGSDFADAHLFTTKGNWQFRSLPEGKDVLKGSRPAFTAVPSPEHDREKRRDVPIDQARFLIALGITSASGEVRPGMSDKLRQIERFVEILGHSVDGSILRDRKSCRVLDMGAGKGYLTFAAAEFFRGRGVKAEITGVEARADLVEKTNRAAKEAGCEGLRFVRGKIGEAVIEGGFDLLLALHACDTATDDALAQGIGAGASLILASPCCHKEVRSNWRPPDVLAAVLSHGILSEREAEIVTDGIRALLLEIHGYDAKVFEFISPDHTGKNLMIAGQKRVVAPDAAPLRERLRALLDLYGIREQRLARLLGELH